MVLGSVVSNVSIFNQVQGLEPEICTVNTILVKQTELVSISSF